MGGEPGSGSRQACTAPGTASTGHHGGRLVSPCGWGGRGAQCAVGPWGGSQLCPRHCSRRGALSTRQGCGSRPHVPGAVSSFLLCQVTHWQMKRGAALLPAAAAAACLPAQLGMPGGGCNLCSCTPMPITVWVSPAFGCCPPPSPRLSPKEAGQTPSLGENYPK